MFGSSLQFSLHGLFPFGYVQKGRKSCDEFFFFKKNLSLQFFLLPIDLSFVSVSEVAAFCVLGMETVMVA
jgi:hypothetical protein